MVTTDFGVCPFHGPVAAQPDFSVAILVVLVLTCFIGIGLILLPVYVIYIYAFKDRVCPYCGTLLLPGPAPAFVPVYQVPVYYPYPPPYYPPGRR